MNQVEKLLKSGLVELYVLGEASEKEASQIRLMARLHQEVRDVLQYTQKVFKEFSDKNAVTPDPVIKPFLMATIDYMQRLENGEMPSFPPELTKNSQIADFNDWLSRPDMQPSEGWSDIEAKIIGHTSQMTTAIVWIQHEAPPETHTDQLEHFLIVEGSCNVQLEGQDNFFHEGDYFTIPLHVSHTVLIVSDIPCKAIIQRVAV